MLIKGGDGLERKFKYSLNISYAVQKLTPYLNAGKKFKILLLRKLNVN
jgi:hypothetical protein